ncbi:hypothetical protein [Rhodopseudomonas palustris]|uniref:hypothetical protein n=1 Tax=Rhodopseudomonas palustris TaxID=1076 RepID=UPI0021F378F5|nr:hypothetical protein [Rhodopseudomonas palustris]UYO56070.1 hypothetical protein KQX61_11970 [Rhodopseudomonas palustris]
MIDVDAGIEAELREAVRLAKSYAVDYFRALGATDVNTIPRETFIARCHEGFHLAQERVLKNVLSLQQRLRLVRAQIQKQSKGKKRAEIQRDEVAQSLYKEEARLLTIENAFRRIADTIAWQILRFNRVLMRSTHTGHDGGGYLSDSNIASAVEAIAKLRKPGEFYLINDLTLCLGDGAGDLTVVKIDQSIAFAELKTGAVNARIVEFLQAYGEKTKEQILCIEEGNGPRTPEECPVHSLLDANSDLLTDNRKRKQIERMVRQMERMNAVLEYEHNNIGIDISLTAKGKPINRSRIAYVSETKDEYAFAEIRDALTNVSSSAPYFSYLDYGPLLTFLVTDNLKSDAFSLRRSPFVRTMNAKHMIYHHLHPELNDCRLMNGGKEGGQEFVAYSKLFLLNWATQVLADWSVMPPYIIPLGDDLIFDLLFGRRSLYVYFDAGAFADFVTEAADGRFVLKPGGLSTTNGRILPLSFPVQFRRMANLRSAGA